MRHQVVGDDDRRGPRLLGEQVVDGTLGGIGAEAAVEGERQQASRPHRLRVALEPLLAGLDVRPAADVRDPLVTQPEQVLGESPQPVDVVADDGVRGGLGDLAVERDDRDVERKEGVDARPPAVSRRHDRRQHSLVRKHLEVRPLLVRSLVRVAEQHAVASLVRLVLDDPDRLAEVRVLDVGDDDPDHLRLLSAQVARQPVGPVVHARGRLQHPAA